MGRRRTVSDFGKKMSDSFLKIVALFVNILNCYASSSEPEFTPSAKGAKAKSAKAKIVKVESSSSSSSNDESYIVTEGETYSKSDKSGRGGKGDKAVYYYQKEEQIIVKTSEAEQLHTVIPNSVVKSSPCRMALFVTSLYCILFGNIHT